MACSDDVGKWYDVRDETATWLAIAAFVLLFFSGVLFSVAPRLDISVARKFFTEGVGFVGDTNGVQFVRNGFKLVYIVACAGALVGLAASLYRRKAVGGFTIGKWAYLCLCLAVGPGLVCNLGFKGEWGRARPRQIVEFGGSKAFTPALEPAAQCQTNCSFTCGEASSIYIVFFALGLLLRERSVALLIGGVAFGSLAGLIRMAQGGHFLSDVIFAGITMALVAAALYRFIDAIDRWTWRRSSVPLIDSGGAAERAGS